MILELLFITSLSFQTLHLLVQDWMELYPLNDVAHLKLSMPDSRRLFLIIGNTLPAAIALSLALIYLRQRKPVAVGLYWSAYYAAVIVLMYVTWYCPYFFGAPAEVSREYDRAYGETHQILPRHRDNPRPNTFHVVLHGLFLLNAALAVVIGFNLWQANSRELRLISCPHP